MRRWCVLALLLIAGCGTGQVPIQGTVTLDGVPVEEGSISFFPEAGTNSRKASAAILNGEFSIPLENGPLPGKFKVEISWIKKTGRKIPSADPGMGDVEERIEAIPTKYNTASTLVREIAAGGNKLDFKLEK